MTVIDKIVSPRSVIDDCKPTQTAYQYVFTNLSLVSYRTVCSYHSLKENCVNATELPSNTFQNFMCCPAIYRLCSRIFFGWTNFRRKIVLCSSELSLDTPWNFMRTFTRTFVAKSREQRTKFAHFACITFAQYCTKTNFEQKQGLYQSTNLPSKVLDGNKGHTNSQVA